MNIENQSNLLSNSTSDYRGNLQEAIEAGKRLLSGSESDTDNDLYFKAATHIVEPKAITEEDGNDLEELAEWAENDPANWAGFIANNCGENWGEFAKIVNQYGY